MNKTKSFVKQFIAFVVGDDNTALAEKVYRQADSALNSTISALDGDRIQYEDAVEDAKEGIKRALVNGGQPITNRSEYVTSILEAENKLIQAQDKLDQISKKIEVLKKHQADLSSEVAIEVIEEKK